MPNNSCIIIKTDKFYRGCPVFNISSPILEKCSSFVDNITAKRFFFEPNFEEEYDNNNINITLICTIILTLIILMLVIILLVYVMKQKSSKHFPYFTVTPSETSPL